ncbi:MAG: hypothetical protein ACFCU1_06690 [Sumerlaeia bacterium]
MHGHHPIEIADPGPVGLPKAFKGISYVLIALGALFILNSMLQSDETRLRGFLALLHAYFFFFLLSLGGIVFVAIQYAASARWSIVVRRFAEGFGYFLPISFIMFLFISIAGYSTLYDLNSEIRNTIGKGGLYFLDSGDDLITKSAFLSQPAVVIKGIAFYALWFFLSFKLRGNSLKQDQTKDPDKKLHRENQKWSIIFLITFMYTFSIHAIDLLMALEPKWFSTMFGVYIFAGMLLSTFAVIALITVFMRRNKSVDVIIHKRHLWDLGTWMMAFSCFMMYIGFSQFMLIWYANLPEETFYLIERSQNGWEDIFLSLAFFKWIIPFFALMPIVCRANINVIVPVAIAILIGQWLDLYWVIYPTFYTVPPIPGLAEIGAFLFTLGGFGLALSIVYARHSVCAVGDPYFKMSVDGSYI